MQVYKTFFKIGKKHFGQVILYVFIFTILMFMMSFNAKSEATTRFEAKSVDIVIVDEDDSPLSHALTEYLDSIHEIVPLKSYTDESIQDSLFYQYISYSLTIPDGFEKAIVNGNSENVLKHSQRKDSAAGSFVNLQVDNYLSTVSLYLAGGYDIEDAIRLTMNDFKNAPDVELLSFETTSKGGNDIMFYYFQYFPYVAFMVIVMGMTPILVTFRKGNLKERINCSSTSEQSRNLQIGLACISYSLIVWFFFIIAGVIVFKPANVFTPEGVMCVANSFVFTLIITAITLLISVFNVKDNSLHLIANIVALGMSFLCGVFVPQWFMADKILAVGRFLPAYWYIKITNMVSGFSGETYSYSNFFKYLGIESIFFIAIFTIYMVANKQRKHASLA